MFNHFDYQKEVDEDAISVANQMRDQIEAAMGTRFPIWIPTLFCTRQRDGIDYRIKIKVGEENRYIHVKIHKPLPGENGNQLTLLTHVGGKVYHDPL